MPASRLVTLPHIPEPAQRACEDAPAPRADILLHSFLGDAVSAAGPAARIACALRHFFVARDVAVAMGHYRTPRAAGPCVLTSSARVATLRDEPVMWAPAEAQQFLEHMAQTPWPERPVQIAPVNWSVQVQHAQTEIIVGMAWADAASGFIAWCRLRGLLDFAHAAQLAGRLDRDLSVLRLFASAIRSVHHVKRVENDQQRMLRLRSELDQLLVAADPREQSDLRSAHQLISDLTSNDWYLASYDVQEQLQRVAALVLNRTLQAVEPPDAALTRAIAMSLLTAAATLPSLAAERLRCVAQIIAPQVDSGLPDLMDLGNTRELSPVRLLALAACELHHVRQISTLDEERGCAMNRLPELCRVIRSSLPKVLSSAIRFNAQCARQMRSWPIEWVRIWLRLWLVYDLAEVHAERNALTTVRTLVPEHVAVLRALATTLVECLRERLYVGSPGFVFRSEVLRDGLRVLVQHHAHRKCHVPRELDLPGHLDDVASADQGNVEATEHLDHVLDVYITGYFMANLRVGAADSSEELQRVALHMLEQVELGPSPKASADFHLAYALAALFHDSGMLLFPRFPADHPVHATDDVAQALSCIRNTVREAGRTLVETCVRELELHECIDRVHEPELEAWIVQQRAHGTPNHALLSAWYLLRACTRAACVRPEVIRTAVRATLLHGALGVQIDSSDNAVAALLVVCDEICDWEPGQSSPRPTTLRDGRLLNERELSNTRGRGRTRSLGIAGLWCDDAGNELRVGVHPADGSICSAPAAATWPHIEIGLRAPRELSQSVLELWLRSAQNIGRIRRTPMGWSPSITLAGQVPPRLHAVGQNTRTLLDAVAQRTRSALRGRLHRWLENTAVFPAQEDDSPREAVTLIGLGRPIASDDVVRYFSELLETAHQVVEERERSLRPR